MFVAFVSFFKMLLHGFDHLEYSFINFYFSGFYVK